MNKKRFSKIYVEITNFCNLHCSFCSKDNLLKKEMTLDEFQIVIDKIKDYTNNIYLHVKGEPLLHSKLDNILTICDNNDMKVSITTNGTLLSSKKDILIKHDIKQINVSLHSENNMHNYFSNVFNTCDLLSKKITIIYRLWTLPSMKLDEKSQKIVNKINEHYHLNDEILNKINIDKNIKIRDNIYVDKDYEFVWPRVSHKEDNYGTCLGTRSHIGILSCGTIVPCCLDSSGIINLGNIFQDDLSDILNSDLFKKIENGFRNNKIVCDLCKSCTFRKRFDKERREK